MSEAIEISDELAARCAPIELIVLDVDGVLTDGVIELDDRGVESKRFFVRDGSALVLWRSLGYRAAILSGRWSRAVEIRASELGIGPVIQRASDKAARLLELLDRTGVAPDRTCFVGDDLPDLPALRLVGLAACPADAVAEVREACHLVSNRPGGRGAVRGTIEAILKAQGKWGPFDRSSDTPAPASKEGPAGNPP